MSLRRGLSALAAGVLCTTAVAGCTSDAPDGPAGGQEFIAASLAPVQVQTPDPAPEPEFRRTMFAEATLSDFTPPLDACQGPVAIDVETEDRPILVSEHDYCGGTEWIPELADGDVVELDGPGVQAGLYDVRVVDTHQRRDVYVRDLRPEMDVVLQTCISGSELILVGLTKIDDASAA